MLRSLVYRVGWRVRSFVAQAWYAYGEHAAAKASAGIASLVVGAVGLDVAGLLALVADLLARGRGLGAVAREVAGLATVVALAAVHAVACQGMLAQCVSFCRPPA
jgi:hypothetical protein